MGKKNMILLCLFVCLIFPVTTVYSYGGGGGDGGGASEAEDGFSGGGAVSWSENPNGLDVMGSSIWAGQPENLKKGPYQPGTAVEDAEQDLLDGFKSGEYSSEEVKKNLQWAKKSRIHISSIAQKVLDGLSASTGSATGQSRTGSTAYSYSDPSLYSHTIYGQAIPDATAFALVVLAASTGHEGGGLSNKDAFGALIILAFTSQGYIF